MSLPRCILISATPSSVANIKIVLNNLLKQKYFYTFPDALTDLLPTQNREVDCILQFSAKIASRLEEPKLYPVIVKRLLTSILLDYLKEMDVSNLVTPDESNNHWFNGLLVIHQYFYDEGKQRRDKVLYQLANPAFITQEYNLPSEKSAQVAAIAKGMSISNYANNRRPKGIELLAKVVSEVCSRSDRNRYFTMIKQQVLQSLNEWNRYVMMSQQDNNDPVLHTEPSPTLSGELEVREQLFLNLPSNDIPSVRERAKEQQTTSPILNSFVDTSSLDEVEAQTHHHQVPPLPPVYTDAATVIWKRAFVNIIRANYTEWKQMRRTLRENQENARKNDQNFEQVQRLRELFMQLLALVSTSSVVALTLGYLNNELIIQITMLLLVMYGLLHIPVPFLPPETQ